MRLLDSLDLKMASVGPGPACPLAKILDQNSRNSTLACGSVWLLNQNYGSSTTGSTVAESALLVETITEETIGCDYGCMHDIGT